MAVFLGSDSQYGVGPPFCRPLCSGETPEVEAAILHRSLAVAVHGGLVGPDGKLDAESLVEDGQIVYRAEEMRQVLLRMLALSDGGGFTVGVEDWPRNEEQLQAVSAE